MCVLYVSFGSKTRPRTFGCVAMDSAVLFILSSKFIVYSAGSRVQVVLSGFSVTLLSWFTQKINLQNNSNILSSIKVTKYYALFFINSPSSKFIFK